MAGPLSLKQVGEILCVGSSPTSSTKLPCSIAVIIPAFEAVRRWFESSRGN